MAIHGPSRCQDSDLPSVTILAPASPPASFTCSPVSFPQLPLP